MHNWIVVKLGGTSQCLIGYENIYHMIKTKDHNTKYVFVLSAVSGVTNLLEEFISTKNFKYITDILNRYDILLFDLKIQDKTNINYNTIKQTFIDDMKFYIKATKDNIYIKSRILGYGEILSTNVLLDYLLYLELKNVKLLNAYEFILSKKETFKLYPIEEFYGNLHLFNNLTDSHKDIYITQGFIASTPLKNTILLGRGGSDTTGALIANMLNATEYIVYTDVNGIYTSDPRIIINASIIKKIDYKIAQEFSALGAKIMHPSSILPCMIKNIPIKILSTFNDSNNDLHTYITSVDSKIINTNGIAIQNNVKLIKITCDNMWNNSGFVFDIFRRFSERKLDVNIISTSQFTISTTIDEKDNILVQDLIQDLQEKYLVELIDNCSIVSIISNNINELYKKIKFNHINCHLISIGATNNSISFVIDLINSLNIVKKLHEHIFNN
jgi:aspartate kinase